MGRKLITTAELAALSEDGADIHRHQSEIVTQLLNIIERIATPVEDKVTAIAEGEVSRLVNEKVALIDADAKVTEAAKAFIALIDANGIINQQMSSIVESRMPMAPSITIDQVTEMIVAAISDLKVEEPSSYHFKINRDQRGDMKEVIAVSDTDQNYQFIIERDERRRMNEMIVIPIEVKKK